VSQLKPAPRQEFPTSNNIRAVYFTVVQPGDPREQLFNDAKRAELLGLIDRGTFQLIVEEDIGKMLTSFLQDLFLQSRILTRRK
jgi:hypothetical protein